MSTKMSRADTELLKELVRLIKENDLAEIDFKRRSKSEDTFEIKIVQKGNNINSAPAINPSRDFTSVPPVAQHPPTKSAQELTPDIEDISDHPGAILSPMVGTIYIAPEPGAPAFVQVGDKVTLGQTILIIEAMKTLNQIPATKSGEVKRVLIEDGSPVEFGTPLIIIE